MLCLENQPTALRELLREESMRPDVCYSDEGGTALQFLFTLEKLQLRDMLELARILLDAGFEPDFTPPTAVVNWQDSPLHLALAQVAARQPQEQGDAVALIRLLRERGARLRPGEKLPENLPEDIRAVL